MDISLTQLKGIGPTRVKNLQADGIETVRQLLCCLPVDYKDLSDVRPLASLRPGDVAAVAVMVDGAPTVRRAKGLTITRCRVVDETGRMNAVWYNQPWLKNALRDGEELLLYGRVDRRQGLQITCPSIEKERAIVPVYKPPAGIPQKTFRQLIASALEIRAGQWPDELPEGLRRRHGLCERNFALVNAHRPASREALFAARRRLAFEELLLYQVGLWLLRGSAQKGVAIPCGEREAAAYWDSLPYAPTAAQRRVLSEALRDMAAPSPMARLVQGDVGCGKTAIAFGALYAAAKAGFQGAMMAPTEVLAAQHAESARQVLKPLGVTCGLLTGSMTQKQHREAHEAIQSGAWQVAIGTHALISEGVTYKNLGLVVTDEQHRFGVRQRAMLSAKGDSPNVLVMSATPIPRTLSLILFGDLDVSIVDELPPGRTPVKTRIVPEDKRAGMYGFLREEVQKGRQVYVVCPLVEESEIVEARSAEAVYEDLKNDKLQGLRVGLVHGKMKAADKEAALDAFHAGELDVLVSTTVIEVGVNVPNASCMVIEDADRFGLAQLHQLRGRVGRGSAESWCFLMAEPNEKLKLMTRSSDGFVIAQRDLELRGPGDLFGTRQSGAAMPGIGFLAADAQLLQETHDEARALVKGDTPEARAVIALAREVMKTRLEEVSMS